MKKVKAKNIKTLDMMHIALFVALISVCSWVSIPSTVPLTMQTFGIFCAIGLLGGKSGTITIITYVLLGLVGAPVFAGFKSGVGTLFGATGGYIIGFVFLGMTYWIITSFFGEKTITMIIAMIVSLFVCYAFGTAWFVLMYAQNFKEMGVISAINMCVVPFIIPDVLKVLLATFVVKKVSPYIKTQ